MTAGAASGPSLLQAAQAIVAERTAINWRCPVAKVLAAMSPEMADELRALLLMDKRDMPASVIAKVVNDAGYALTEDPILSHRRALRGGMGCKCRS